MNRQPKMPLKLKDRYLYGVIITIAVLICNQVFIQYWLNKKNNDAHTINVAGRQRMLSQRINLEFYRIEQNTGDTGSLKSLFNEWQEAHLALLDGNASLDIDPVDVEEAKNALTSLKKNIAFINDEIGLLGTGEVSLTSIDANQKAFLTGMEHVVKLLETSSQQKLNFIITMEIVLMLISIIVLFLEVRLIFMPYEKNLRSMVAQLQAKNQKLRDIAWEQSHEVRRPLANAMIFMDIINKTRATATPEEMEEYHLMLSTSLNELDAIIKKINILTNEDDQEGV